MTDQPESHPESRRGRLRKYDGWSIFLQSWTSAFSSLQWLVALGLAIAGGFLGAWLGASAPDSLSDFDGVAITAAVTIAGLAVTTFFVTAQLRVSGIARYGITELYRAREIVPLLITATVCVVGLTVGIAAADGKSPGMAGYFSGFGICALVFLQLVFVHLSLLAVLYLDSVSMARQFAKRVSVTDTDEWGLLHLPTDPVSKQLVFDELAIVSNRMNFGIRDPLMPIHELILASRPKEFGQLLGVLIARVLREYGLDWIAQAPTPNRWKDLETRGVEPSAEVRSAIRKGRRSQSAELNHASASELRLSLYILVFHYIRRIARNGKVDNTPQKSRRDEANQICRFIETIVVGPRDERHTYYAAQSDELRTVVRISLYALLEDFH